MKKTVLFVCTGNTCRSIMAEGIFKQLKKSSNFEVYSAGISALPGMPPTQEAILVMREYNIDISKHKSILLSKALVDGADYIFVMTNQHLRFAINLSPSKKHSIFLLKKFVESSQPTKQNDQYRDYEIIDPIGKDIECYRKVAKEIRENLIITLRRLINNNK